MKELFGGPDDTTQGSFNERGKLFSIYNWELGLHAPMLLVDQLYKAGLYEQALNVCHYVFNPLQNDNGTNMSRFWVFPPFKSIKAATIESYFMDFVNGKPV
jgi:hypothetical protein